MRRIRNISRAFVTEIKKNFNVDLTSAVDCLNERIMTINVGDGLIPISIDSYTSSPSLVKEFFDVVFATRYRQLSKKSGIDTILSKLFEKEVFKEGNIAVIILRNDYTEKIVYLVQSEGGYEFTERTDRHMGLLRKKAQKMPTGA